LKNLVTVYSGQPKVDVTQASQEVLQVLPEIDAGLIEGYILARRESAINGLPAPAFPIASDQDMSSGQKSATASDGVNDASRQGDGTAVKNTSETPVNVGTGEGGVITVCYRSTVG